MSAHAEELLRATHFSPAEIERYLLLEQRGRSEECVRMLQRQRCVLLDALHEAQRPIDIIDWEICRLKDGKPFKY